MKKEELEKKTVVALRVICLDRNIGDREWRMMATKKLMIESILAGKALPL